MKVFIDSRDLIDAFTSEPSFSIGTLAARLRSQEHALVLTFSLISELVPADNNLFTVLRRFVTLEEDFTLAFLQQIQLADREMRQAAEDFVGGRPYSGVDPYVASFIDLWGIRFPQDPIFLMDVNRTVGLRKMSRQIEMLLSRPQVFHWSDAEADRAVHYLLDDQTKPASGDARTRFSETVLGWLKRGGISFDEPDAARFVQHLRQNPRVAPGWRLFSETYDQILRDKNYRPTVNDAWDLSHITLLPYVDALTLDKNKTEAVRKATQRLKTFDPSINYDERVFAKVTSLINHVAP